MRKPKPHGEATAGSLLTVPQLFKSPQLRIQASLNTDKPSALYLALIPGPQKP